MGLQRVRHSLATEQRTALITVFPTSAVHVFVYVLMRIKKETNSHPPTMATVLYPCFASCDAENRSSARLNFSEHCINRHPMPLPLETQRVSDLGTGART